jgi:nitroreductase
MSTTQVDAATVLEALGTARAVRYFEDRPVPPELVEQLIWAATRAPSPENTQQWAFICIDDKEILGRIQGATSFLGPILDQKERIDGASSDRTLRGAAHLVTRTTEIPLLIVVCGHLTYPEEAPDELMNWSALYPAAQNIVVAARALGLGAAFTLMQLSCEPVIRAELGLPDDMVIAAVLPIGYPATTPGPVKRRPVSEVLYMNRYEPRS